ncbi:MAG: ribonuclease III [Myxococcota bacterium]|jgi:ribonuclease-3|nr:ribonuclease III [Myxococcota bacterium]
MSIDDFEASLATLLSRLGHEFADPLLARLALTHKSYANEQVPSGGDNQRLEFLGDAVLGLVVAEALMEQLPWASEGELTPRRAALVNEATLAEVALDLDLGAALLLGRGEEMSFGRRRQSILADATEALIGAVYLDGGLDAARKAALGLLADRLSLATTGKLQGDPKTELQEQLQAKGLEPPTYRIADTRGPDHDKEYEVEILAAGQVLAVGIGRSKKEAEKRAAQVALDALAQPPEEGTT